MFKYSYSNTISLFAIVMIGTELHIVFNYTLNVSNSIVFSRCSSSRNSLRGITHSPTPHFGGGATSPALLVFLAVQDSSIGDLVTDSLTHSVTF